MIIAHQGRKPSIGNNVFIADGAAVIGDVRLAGNASVWFGAVLRADLAHIEVGEGSNIQDNVTVHVVPDKPVVIGKNVTVGHNAVLHGCTVEDGALIGMGAVILDGAVVGAGAIVGAGALVTPGTVIEPGRLALGAPAKVVKELSPEQAQGILRNAKDYVALAASYLNG